MHGGSTSGVVSVHDGHCDKCEKVTKHLKHYTSDRKLYRTECLECGQIEYYA